MAGQRATVDGREMPLDRAGTHATGDVTLDVPEVRLRFSNAALADSVTVRAQ